MTMEWFASQPWGRYAEVASYVVTSASALLLGLSKLTKTDWDDKAAAWFLKYPLKALKLLSLAPKTKS
jgi:hypothetical protein